MANRVEVFQVPINPGTAKANPAVTLLPFNDGVIEEIQIIVPDGVAGLAGFQITYGGQQIIPNTRGAFIVSNDEKIIWTVEHLPEGSQWAVAAYNTDVFTHTLYLRFLVSDFGLATPSLTVQPALAIPPVFPQEVTA